MFPSNTNIQNMKKEVHKDMTNENLKCKSCAVFKRGKTIE